MNMNMMKRKKVKQLNKVYKLCENIFCTGTRIMDVGHDFAMDDAEKREFFGTLLAYFTAKKQDELIEKGIF